MMIDLPSLASSVPAGEFSGTVLAMLLTPSQQMKIRRVWERGSGILWYEYQRGNRFPPSAALK